MGRRKLAHQNILGVIGILILIDKDMKKAFLISGKNLRLCSEEFDSVGEDVVKIHAVLLF